MIEMLTELIIGIVGIATGVLIGLVIDRAETIAVVIWVAVLALFGVALFSIGGDWVGLWGAVGGAFGVAFGVGIKGWRST